MSKEFDEDAIINPTSGLYARNPTHIEEAELAETQDDIVKAVKGTPNIKPHSLIYRYDKIEKQAPPPLSGIIHIRTASLEEATGLCQSLMRHRRNVFYAKIKLGEYPTQQLIRNRDTAPLNSEVRRFPTEVGKIMGGIFANEAMYVTEIEYSVNNLEPGTFHAMGKVMGVDKKTYENDALFAPTIELHFIKNT